MRITELINYIFAKFNNDLNKGEETKFQAWMEQSDERKKLLDSLQDKDQVKHDLRLFKSFNKEKSWQKLQDRIGAEKPKQKFVWYRVAAVALILIVAASVLYYQSEFSPRNTTVTEIIPPGEINAILKIEDQETIIIRDTLSIPVISGVSQIAEITNGKLQYNHSEVIESKRMEIVVPERSEFYLKLSDGSELWMNAGSKAIFMQPFTNQQRNIYVEGEAYFKVNKDTDRPFIVDVLGQNKIEVLGTQFNVCAYADEQNYLTTLVEGGIAWEDAENKIYMEPNQMLNYSVDTKKASVSDVNTYQYTAWIEGRFVFENTALSGIMKTMGRWYGVDFNFDNKQLEETKFSVDVKRYENMHTILEMLEITQKVKFEIDGKEVFVKDYN